MNPTKTKRNEENPSPHTQHPFFPPSTYLSFPFLLSRNLRLLHLPPFLLSAHDEDNNLLLSPLSAPGAPASQIFTQGVCYTYDDIIFHPAHIHFPAHEVDISSHVTKGIKLQVRRRILASTTPSPPNVHLSSFSPSLPLSPPLLTSSNPHPPSLTLTSSPR